MKLAVGLGLEFDLVERWTSKPEVEIASGDLDGVVEDKVEVAGIYHRLQSSYEPYFLQYKSAEIGLDLDFDSAPTDHPSNVLSGSSWV